MGERRASSKKPSPRPMGKQRHYLLAGVVLTILAGALVLVWHRTQSHHAANRTQLTGHSHPIPTPPPRPILPVIDHLFLTGAWPTATPPTRSPAAGTASSQGPSPEPDFLYEEPITGDSVDVPVPPPPPMESPPPPDSHASRSHVTEPRPGGSPGKVGKTGRIAIIIDDLGYHAAISKAVAHLPADITLAILPNGPFSREVAILGKGLGKEIILHQPMEPMRYPQIDPGPGAILRNMSEERIRQVLRHNLAAMPEAVGLNNHMGSGLTAERPAMTTVMHILAEQGKFFIDSRTAANSVGIAMAENLGVPRNGRDIFLDNTQTLGSIHSQLVKLEAIARSRGDAIGIGHPYPATLAALEKWLPEAQQHGFTILRVSQMLGPTIARKNFPLSLALRHQSK